jgi:hypothetical protein
MENVENPVNQEQQNEKKGVLTIKWEGKWMLMDSKLFLTANGKNLGIFSFKKGFVTTMPLTSESVVLTIQHNVRNQSFGFPVNPSENYTLTLTYDRMTISFGFMLFDQNGKRVK